MVWLTEVRREEEEREWWSVFLMESDSQGGGRDVHTRTHTAFVVLL